MTSCKCRRLIEKEQLCVIARIHDFALDALELNQARDPGIPLGTRNDFPCVVVKTTPVAHQHSPS